MIKTYSFYLDIVFRRGFVAKISTNMKYIEKSNVNFAEREFFKFVTNEKCNNWKGKILGTRRERV